VTTVDARGLTCPLPLALARREMAALRSGETLVVLATDPESPLDMAAWAADDGHRLEQAERDGYLEFRFVKA
jgi:tRNA 2-thiouridine synthesizing protein A